ncbi:MAG: IPTL-CTERM sorting domain-containing protein [Thermodesulfobacteriota bacterium]
MQTDAIPTLSEWGLIAMAGIILIFGLFAVSKRKVTA